MGVFNRILVTCPACGAEVEFQTKSGSCQMKSYPISSVPPREVEGILGESVICNCGHFIIIGGENEDIKEVRSDFSNLVH